MNPLAFHEWEKFFNSPDSHFQTLYGSAPELIPGRKQAFRELLRHFKTRFPSQAAVFLIRIPARINLKGVHVEHRGGFMNTLTIAKEMLLAVAPRRDSQIHCTNVNPVYPDFNFDIADEFPAGRKVDWLEYINQVAIEKGRWENYIKAVSYYLQNRFEQPLNGMDVAVSGQIPPAAGLSSSSALVVGAIQALNYINQLQLSQAEMTLMCGEAEWFVGTRGGAGDHASIIFGRRNYITHLQFFPLKVELIPMPRGLTIVTCHSQVEAKKSAGARDIFNARVTTYEIAFRLFKKYFPAFKDKAHLRDLIPRYAGIELAQLYRMLQALPIRLTRTEIYQALPESQTELDRLFSTHQEPAAGYPLRAVSLFGFSEIERGDLAGQLLRNGDLKALGEIMYIAHDGDRVTRHHPNAPSETVVKNFEDGYFEELIQALSHADPREQQRAQLAYQPGGYDCSTPELDLLVDLARRVSGVCGAGLTGAGLGGAVLVLIEKESLPELRKTLDLHYYRPRQLALGVEECIPIDGATILEANLGNEKS